MSEQTTLDEAINRVAEHANSAWMAEAREAVKVLCRRGREFTTDDIYDLMTLVNIETRDKRAMGAITRWAAVERLAVNTGRVVKSKSIRNHHRPLAVWRPL
jgi:hypothetical protein